MSTLMSKKPPTKPRVGKKKFGAGALDHIERVGNKLPEPFALFLYLFLAIGIISTVVSWFNVSTTLPGAETPTLVKGLFTGEGIVWLMTTAVQNFIGFPPLGVVVTLLLAVGVAERTGLLLVLVKSTLGRAPGWALPYVMALVALCAHIMSDASILVIPPIAAMVFRAAGRNPVAGLLGSYAIGLAAFSCTPFVTSTDALLAGISNAAAAPVAEMVLPVTAVSNLLLNIVLAGVLTIAGGLVIDKVLEPRLNRAGVGVNSMVSEDANTEVTAAEKSALRWAGLALLAVVGLVLALSIPEGAPLRNEAGDFLPKSPLLSSVIFIVFCVLLAPSIVYGARLRLITNIQSVVEMMGQAVKDAVSFIIVAFILAQFLALFTWSGLASWVAVNGAQMLKDMNFTGYGAIIAFIVVVSILNLLISSGSSLWTLIAAVFIPMFALIGYEAGFIQSAFRVGDSATQVLTPLNPYLVVVLGFLRRYEPEAGIGSIIARLLPFTLVFWVLWVLVLTVFFLTGTGTGPGMDIMIG
ncbi:AbgT family transporter [Paeniglutamicibacter psychrophenolicus]|uniref:Aminobenzoyl-glutamate transport protein n=1 Tax=Paeniglutamicibacter psychrophenolicus TaxID=257454 RepID=A0ABS4W7G2_9MICC|nr:AbgT family transporter [Paeniglutamicibacter psychrophenolicus]MBP2372142.1 aminobenzoyl-glutamate transport protein [Paeniglutamicibacter psychrophenolicus]